jgi:hypothetical protein
MPERFQPSFYNPDDPNYRENQSFENKEGKTFDQSASALRDNSQNPSPNDTGSLSKSKQRDFDNLEKYKGSINDGLKNNPDLSDEKKKSYEDRIEGFTKKQQELLDGGRDTARNQPNKSTESPASSSEDRSQNDLSLQDPNLTNNNKGKPEGKIDSPSDNTASISADPASASDIAQADIKSVRAENNPGQNLESPPNPPEDSGQNQSNTENSKIDNNTKDDPRANLERLKTDSNHKPTTDTGEQVLSPEHQSKEANNDSQTRLDRLREGSSTSGDPAQSRQDSSGQDGAKVGDSQSGSGQTKLEQPDKQSDSTPYQGVRGNPNSYPHLAEVNGKMEPGNTIGPKNQEITDKYNNILGTNSEANSKSNPSPDTQSGNDQSGKQLQGDYGQNSDSTQSSDSDRENLQTKDNSDLNC